jgi:DNA mismatch endonuclease (patch repair protein)
MARIRSSNTSPELALRKALHSVGLRFRLHRKDLPGRPDIVLPRYRIALFVHGCFWHRHNGCKVATTPKSNTAFWVEKFAKNSARDARCRSLLELDGWTVLVAWECELASKKRAAEVALQVLNTARTLVGSGST